MSDCLKVRRVHKKVLSGVTIFIVFISFFNPKSVQSLDGEMKECERVKAEIFSSSLILLVCSLKDDWKTEKPQVFLDGPDKQRTQSKVSAGLRNTGLQSTYTHFVTEIICDHSKVNI